ncbi:MAG: glycosyltransferase, partial [Clostridia bacterium]|nr:glycosyltransferase [Clostridia bacterium]
MNIVFVADRHADEKDAKDTFGAFIWVSRVVTQLKALGHNVCVIAENEQALGVFAMPSKSHRIVNFLLKKQIPFGKCDETITRKALEDADIVHFITPFGLSASVRKIAADMEIPCVASFSCVPEDVLSRSRINRTYAKNYLYRRWNKRIYKHISDIHCLTPLDADRLSEHGYISELHVIGNGQGEPFLDEPESHTLGPQVEVDAKQMLSLY